MHKTGTADLPLHFGKAPPWLFKKMVSLSGEIITLIADEYGKNEVLTRFSSPYFFQAFSCVIGFDWHSSGTTTVTMGAVKEALKSLNMGLSVVGGKGKESRATKEELNYLDTMYNFDDKTFDQLNYATRIVAKVDNSLIQDGFDLYHHTMLVTDQGSWAVIQQGMNLDQRYARRYHWLGSKIESFTDEPHTGIASDLILERVLDLTSKRSEDNKKTALDLVNDNFKHIRPDIVKVSKSQKTIDEFAGFEVLKMPWTINWNALKEAYEIQPKNYEQFIVLKGIGPSTIRALAYIAEIAYGKPPSWADPVKYSFALGGKDGVPKPIDHRAYNQSISFLKDLIRESEINIDSKKKALLTLFHAESM